MIKVIINSNFWSKKFVIFTPKHLVASEVVRKELKSISLIFKHAQMMQILGQNFQSFLMHRLTKLFSPLPLALCYYLIYLIMLLFVVFFLLFVFLSCSTSTSSTIVKTMVQHTGDSPSLLREMEKRYKREK